jgi:cell division protease FtsH
MARLRLREGRGDASTPEDIERALTEYEDKLNLTPKEKKLLATHEAGHFVVALHCPHHPPPERITIHSEMSWAPAYVRFKQDDSRRLGETRNQMMDDLTVLVGGIEAERLLLDDISTGAGGSDLQRASIIAHLLIETYGMGQGETGLRQYRSPRDGNRYGDPSEEHKRMIDHEVSALIRDAQQRAQRILTENRDALLTLRDMVIEKGTLEVRALKSLFPSMKTEESEASEKGNGEVKEKAEKRPRKSSKTD